MNREARNALMVFPCLAPWFELTLGAPVRQWIFVPDKFRIPHYFSDFTGFFARERLL